MRKYLETYYKGLAQGLGLLSIFLVTGVAYGAYITLSNVESGETLTASSYNQLITNVSTIKTTLDGVSTQIVPAGFVGAFNLSTCPTGWIAANGSNGTPDLRGEFIRGLDSGRGIDSGRTLASSQLATRVISYNSTTNGYQGGLYDHDISISTDYDGNIESITGTNGNFASSASSAPTWAVYGIRVRPRNVALLYCVKQ